MSNPMAYYQLMTGKDAENTIPPLVMKGLIQYRDHHVPVGGFLRAVLTNNLKEAVTGADQWSMWALPAIVGFVMNKMPMACQGSEAKYESWISEQLSDGKL